MIGLSILALAGCATTAPSGPTAGPSGSPSAAPSPTQTTPAPPPAQSELIIVVDDGGGQRTTWRLTCDPPGGDHPDPVAACQALSANGARALDPVPKDRKCAQIYGGDQRATVSGTWQGKPVRSRFSLTDGCEISRWKALVGLLPPAGA